MWKRLSLIALFALPATATEYAIPNGFGAPNDCPALTGYLCLPDSTSATFQIAGGTGGSGSTAPGAMSYPPPYLAMMTPAQQRADGILAVTMSAPPDPARNAVNGYSFQLSNGVVSQVWNSTPLTAVQLASIQYQAAITAGLTISCATTATICTSDIAGTYAIDANAQANIADNRLSILADGAMSTGASTMPWADASGVLHTMTIPQFSEFATAVKQYVAAWKVYVLTIQAGGNASPPAATAQLP